MRFFHHLLVFFFFDAYSSYWTNENEMLKRSSWGVHHLCNERTNDFFNFFIWLLLCINLQRERSCLGQMARCSRGSFSTNIVCLGECGSSKCNPSAAKKFVLTKRLKVGKANKLKWKKNTKPFRNCEKVNSWFVICRNTLTMRFRPNCQE